MTVFADTSFWVALLRPRDQYRAVSLRWKAWLTSHRVHLVTTEAVLWEWLNLCASQETRGPAALSYRDCQSDERIEVIPWRTRWTSAAFALYEQRLDKEWSLTDCLSFEIMRTRRMTEALTADHHFTQAGFRALLLEEPLT
jgi:predicted nucleic acid-binding protein